MDNASHSQERLGAPDRLDVIRLELADRLAGAADFRISSFAEAQLLDDDVWRHLADKLADPDSMDAVDWREPPTDTWLETNLDRLASIKAVLPEDNISEQKDQHNITIENHIKLSLEAAQDISSLRVFTEFIRAKLIKGAPDPSLAQQVFWIWAPAAEIAGWHGLRTELEELAFDHLYPEEKQDIIDTYADLGGDEALAGLIDGYKEGMGLILGEELDDGINFAIKGRRKSYYSVWRKATKRLQAADHNGPDYSLTDFLGMRVVIHSDGDEIRAIKACYKTGDIISQCFTPVPGRRKNYIASPKANGYQSLHMTVNDVDGTMMEFQIRTDTMHRMADRDPNVSHMTYDASTKITPGKVFRNLPKPHRIYNWRERAAAKISSRKQAGDESLAGLEPGNLLVFARDGNMYQLEDGATALDFAFAVHTAEALSVREIIDDGSPVRFDRPLRHGEKLDLSYYRDRRLTWSDAWMGKVNSHSARVALRRAQRQRDRQGHILRGVALLEQDIRAHGEIPDSLGAGTVAGLDDELRNEIAEKYGTDSFETVLASVGGSQDVHTGRAIHLIKRHLESQGLLELSEEPGKPDRYERPIHTYSDEEGNRWGLVIDGWNGCEHHFAGCCPAHVGEAYVAVASRLTGDFSIHRTDCVNLPVDNDRALPCAWQELGD